MIDRGEESPLSIISKEIYAQLAERKLIAEGTARAQEIVREHNLIRKQLHAFKIV